MHIGQIDVEGNAIALVSMTDPKSEIEAVQGTSKRLFEEPS